ncbi:4-coumarate--CoA ligase-like 6 [Morus notabilis]|uniref:4-coumarate--CoA ligase n=1 Tax=Morus notabilis TaxID=981085 RepID=W9QEH3_9ROSA|nr:4-coumarate--CoA ligase-like 6 isoform X2 [Morus notabilis]EXB31005.1 4-coumarate--CoA ligase-like 6 [Morus notabilis]
MSTLNSENIDDPNKYEYPNWYSPETGIYNSTHPPRNLPSDTFLDVVSFLFSCQHKGVSALIDASSGVSIPYSELYSSVKSMASGLHSTGVTKGDVVLVMLPNSIYFPVVLLGVLHSGAIFTPMNPLSSVTEIEKRVADCKPCLAFTVPEKVDIFRKLGVAAIGVPDQNVSLGDFLDFSKLISSDYNLASRPLIMQEDTAAIMYSSGTTGLSKGVVLSHGNFIAMIELFVRFEASQYDYPSSEIVYLAVLPMFHVYGLAYFAMGLFSLGSTVVVMRKFDMNEVARAVEKYRVTHIAAVPPILTALTKAAKNNGGKSFRSLKQVSSGAAPPSRKMIEELVQVFPHVDFIQGYGMTESTAIGTRGFNTKNCRDYSSAGLLAPNTQAKVVDWKTGSLLPPGNSGELWLRGPGVMKGYLNNDSTTMSSIDKDGWLRTGDIAYFDQNGYLYIVDRLKEMIKYKGFQIAPADLEAVLASHPEILDVGVTAVMDEDCGEIPVAFVVRKQGSSLCHEDVINHVARQVAPYKKIRKVVFTNSIPKSPAGKILRRELRESLTSKL